MFNCYTRLPHTCTAWITGPRVRVILRFVIDAVLPPGWDRCRPGTTPYTPAHDLPDVFGTFHA